MTNLEIWLKDATRHLSKDSVIQVRTEIQEHFNSATEAAIGSGIAPAEAERLALKALGDSAQANRQYRKVLLTASEARLLREGNSEARAICSRPWLKSLLLAIPISTFSVAAALFLSDSVAFAKPTLLAGIALTLLCAAPLLPVYTPLRGLAFRCVKWTLLIGTFVLAFGPNLLESFWLFASCLWPLAWIEWTRVAIRRKLPVANWPKHLHL